MLRAASLAVCALLLAGCGSSGTSPGTSSTASIASTAPRAAGPDEVTLRDDAVEVTNRQSSILQAIVNCSDDQQPRLIEKSCETSIVVKGEEAKGAVLVLVDQATGISSESPCAGVAHTIVKWATSFPDDVDAFVGDVGTGELAAGYDRYRSSLDQWTANMNGVMSCSSGS